MGLLDDAIREHLELKRRRGADPGSVAREERDAFGQPGATEPSGVDDGSPEGFSGPARESTAGEGSVSPVAASARDDLDAATAPAAPAGLGQETVELDMRTVLDDEPGEDLDAVAGEAGEPRTGPGRAAASTTRERDATDDSLEWEVPGDQRADEDPAADEQEAPEDVLEETPDFLRDTPEQDRLWFEQRPPRDFDFDK